MSNETDQTARERIEDEAAEWVLKLNEGSLSDDTLAQWRRWIDSSTYHLTAYEKMSKLWAVADELPLQLGADETVAETMGSRWGLYWQQFWHGLMKPQVAAVATVCLVAVVWGVYTTSSNSISFPAVELGHISGIQTAVGDHQEYRLPDGSVVELAGDSHIELDYSEQERRIRLLRGEALFDVKSNPAQPFIVSAGAGEYRALGTAFNVHAGIGQSTLTVVEGMVQASASGSEADYTGSNYPRLVAGESLAISNDGSIGEVTEVDPSIALGWRTGLFTFSDAPLNEVFATISRYHKVPIDTSPKLQQLKYTGSIHRDSIEGLLDVLPEVFPVTVVRTGGKVIIRPAS